MKISYQLDLSELPRITRAMKTELDKEIEQVVMNTTRKVSLNAKSFVTVKEAGIKSSIRPLYKGKTGEVIVSSDHAPYVEFGTGSKAIIPTELKAIAAQWWTHKQWEGMDAQPYYYPAVFIGRDKFNKDMDAAYGKVINKRR